MQGIKRDLEHTSDYLLLGSYFLQCKFKSVIIPFNPFFCPLYLLAMIAKTLIKEQEQEQSGYVKKSRHSKLDELPRNLVPEDTEEVKKDKVSCQHVYLRNHMDKFDLYV